MFHDWQASNYLILLCLHLMNNFLQLEEDNLTTLLKLHVNEHHRLTRSLHMEQKRPAWDVFITITSSSHFHRMFRMETRSFYKISAAIETAIGKDTCKSEYNFIRCEHPDWYGYQFSWWCSLWRMEVVVNASNTCWQLLFTYIEYLCHWCYGHHNTCSHCVILNHYNIF